MIITKGSTDVTTYVMLVDSAAGTPETGYTIANLDLQYTRNRETPATKADATALAATNTAHTDNYAIQIDATSSPGLYRVDWPDAAFATGADKVILVVSGTGLAPAVLHVELVNYNTQDGVRMGLTALPNAAADAAGGLIISDAGGLDADAQRSDVAAILVDTGTTLDGRIPAALVGGRMDANVGAISADATAADNAEAFFDGTGYAGTGNVIPTVTTTTNLTTNNDKTGYALTSAYDFAKGTVAMTESYAADGAAPTPAQALFMIQQFQQEKSISSVTLTVKKLDGTTSAATFTLDDATTPTSITRAS